MRKFDVDSVSQGLDQYWSALSYGSGMYSDLYSDSYYSDTFQISPQVGSNVSGIRFSSDHVTNNQNISRNSTYAVSLDNDPGVVYSAGTKDFTVSMLIKPKISELWLIRIVYNGQSIGVKINSDTSMTLYWPVQNTLVDADGNITSGIVIDSKSVVYSENVSYFVLNVNSGVASLTLNNATVTIQGVPAAVESFEFGGGTGSALIDKIGFSKSNVVLSPSRYFSLFKNERLDTVPRPSGMSTFNYLLDAYRPDQTVLDSDSFVFSEDYSYAQVINPYSNGVFQVFRRADFLVEYSTDNGDTWNTLDSQLKTGVVPSLSFRHQTAPDDFFFIDVRLTSDVDIPMSYFDVAIAGQSYLPAEIETGYYDADAGDLSDTVITLTPLENDHDIRTVEFLGSVDDLPNIVYTNNGSAYTSYINGKLRDLSTMKPKQIYHVVLVFANAVSTVALRPELLVGLGVSDTPYTESDAYYIYNTFAGNTLIGALDTTGQLHDGVSISGNPASALDLQWDK